MNRMICVRSPLDGSGQSGPSSDKGKPQKRKLPASSSKEGDGDVVKSKKRRKNEAPSEEHDRFV